MGLILAVCIIAELLLMLSGFASKVSEPLNHAICCQLTRLDQTNTHRKYHHSSIITTKAVVNTGYTHKSQFIQSRDSCVQQRRSFHSF